MLIELAIVAAGLQQGPPDPTCQADVRWAVAEQRTASRSPAAPPRALSLFTAVGSAGRPCRPVEITLTAAYFKNDGELLCSGAIPGIALHGTAATQLTDLEIRPGALVEFARWRNAGRNLRRTVALVCTSSDGITEVQPDELVAARTLRLWATIATTYTGIATDELVLTLVP